MLKFILILSAGLILPHVSSACATGAKCVSVGDAQLMKAGIAASDATDGARWLRAPERVAPTLPLAAAGGEPLSVSPIYEQGDILPRGRYSMLMNSAYHGLPPAPEGTLYFEVDLKVMLVDIETYEILQDVSRDVAATF